MIIDFTRTKIERELESAYDTNYVWTIQRKTISGCVCACGSVDFGLVTCLCVLGENGRELPIHICKDCNYWKWI